MLPPRQPCRRGSFAHMRCESLSHRREKVFFFLGAKLMCYNHEALDCVSKKQIELPTGTGMYADSSVAFIIVRDKWP